MQTISEPRLADRRALQLIGMTLAALLVATTLIAAMLVHRGPTGETYGANLGSVTERIG